MELEQAVEYAKNFVRAMDYNRKYYPEKSDPEPSELENCMVSFLTHIEVKEYLK